MLKKKVYTVPEAATICSVGRTTMWRWVKSGEVTVSKTLGGRFLISKEHLENFILAKGLYPVGQKISSSSKVLLVDDNPDIRELLAPLISQEGYQVEVAESGFEAGAKLMAFEPDLVILDIVMPGIDGFAICKQLKGDPRTANVRILAITGYDTDEHRDGILAAGADGYLPKPLDPSTLLQHMEHLLTYKASKMESLSQKTSGIEPL